MYLLQHQKHHQQSVSSLCHKNLGLLIHYYKIIAEKQITVHYWSELHDCLHLYIFPKSLQHVKSGKEAVKVQRN